MIDKMKKAVSVMFLKEKKKKKKTINVSEAQLTCTNWELLATLFADRVARLSLKEKALSKTRSLRDVGRGRQKNRRIGK